MSPPYVFEKEGNTYENWPLEDGFVRVRITDAAGNVGEGYEPNGVDARIAAEHNLSLILRAGTGASPPAGGASTVPLEGEAPNQDRDPASEPKEEA